METWNEPELRKLNFKETECGAWRYAIKCSNYLKSCNNYFYTFNNCEGDKCSYCNGILEIDAKWWSQDYCDGTCIS